jgi:RNA polymerase sigma-70 factor (ECF subfamily)
VLSDGRLVRLARAGDAAAFDRLIERHAGMVYMIARARLRDPEITEDLVQEVFLRVHLHLHQLGDPDRLAPWLASLTRNLAVDWLRRGQRRSQLIPMVSLDESIHALPDTRTKGARETMATDQERQAVYAAIDRLPPEQREVVLLHFAEDLKQVEIAERLGMRPNHVHRLLKRALASLKGMVEPTLREAAPALRMPRQVLSRTSMLVGAAAVLSTGAREALAAAAAASMPAVSVSSAKAGVAGVAAAGAAAKSGLLGFVQSTWASFASGGAVMGIGKGTAAVVVIAAAGALGYSQFKSSDKPPSLSDAVVHESFTPAPQATTDLAAEPVQLVCNLTAGTVYRSAMRMNLAQDITGAGLPPMGVHTEIGVDGDCTTNVRERTADGTFHLQMEMGNMRVTRATTTVNGQTTDISNDSQLLAQTGQYLDMETEFSLDTGGNITSFNMAGGGGPANVIQELMTRASSGYPTQAVRPGDRWTRRFELPGSPGVGINVTCTLTSVEVREGRRVGTIRRVAQVDINQALPVENQPGMPPGTRMELTSLRGTVSCTGQMWLDTTVPIEDHVSADLTIAMAVQVPIPPSPQNPMPQSPQTTNMQIHLVQNMQMTHELVSGGDPADVAAPAATPETLSAAAQP